MILDALEVWSWRSLPHLCLDGFAEGINLIAGPNESGKSSLVEALRYALFEPYKGGGEVKERVQPWGAAEGPQVRLAWRDDAGRWELRKQFLRAPGAWLQGPGGSWRDEDAEAQLRARMGGLGRRGRGELSRADMGLWALLLVEQGRAREVPHRDLSDETRGRLQASVAASVGDLTGGADGARWLQRAREENERYWGANGREVKELERASRAAAEAEAAAGVARRRRDEVHELADQIRLAEERERRLRDEVAHLRARVTETAAAAERVRAVDARLATLAAEIESRGLRAEAARRDRDAAAAFDAAIARLGPDEARLAEACRVASGSVDAAARDRVDAAEALGAAQLAEAGAREVERRSRRLAERGPLEERRSALAAAIENERALREELAGIRAAIAGNPVEPKSLDELRRLDRELRAAEARLDGAAARVRVQALADTQVDGEALEAGRDRTLSVDAARSIRIGDVAVVTVEPGGDELPKWRKERNLAASARRDALSRLQVADLPEAEARGSERVMLHGRLKPLEDALKRALPQGADAAAAELRTIDQSLGELASVEAPPLAEADRALVAAVDAGRRAREAEAAAVAALDARRERLALAQREHDRARSELDRARGDRAALRGTEVLEADLVERTRVHGEAVAMRVALAQERQDRGGDDAVAEAGRVARASSNLEAQLAELRLRLAELRARLDVAGGSGAHDALLEAESVVAATAEELARTRRRAEATRALLGALQRARAQAHERLAAPVVARIEPYLRSVFAGSEADLDAEGWTLRGIRTRGVDEPFEALSGGAQEQVATLVRLALAEVLAGGGRLPVVLDDSLVNTDEQRRRRMLTVLDRASRHLQLLVLTCHPEAFAELGESRRFDLESGRLRG